MLPVLLALSPQALVPSDRVIELEVTAGEPIVVEHVVDFSGRLAKRTLRDDGAPVRDWAGWVLTGDPE